jgi:hypothetical protein
MGLLYPFPVSSDEPGFARLENGPTGRIQKVTLKSYGLPYIFWGYALASLAVLFFLWLAVREPMEKLAALGGPDALLVWALRIFIYSLPLIVLGFFFYEKTLTSTPGQLTVGHRLYGIKCLEKTYPLAADPFVVDHFIDAPNVARLKGGPEAVGFQNKGYFTLWARLEPAGVIRVDRHSRKSDLEALAALLSLAASR